MYKELYKYGDYNFCAVTDWLGILLLISDMAAIPDYSSGATEHWGIITFRETSIFYNQNQSSAVNKQRVASVVAHELAHQWFGNLGMLVPSV